MKDVVDNRRRIRTFDKLRIATQILRQNGLVFCCTLAAYYFSSALADKAFKRLSRVRDSQGLPGLNSVAINKSVWESWDWGAAGEEWTPSDAWKSSLITEVLLRHMPSSGHLLEIGPGGGRWAEHLIPIAESYTGIDLSEAAAEHCRRRFPQSPNARFLVGSGTDLRGIDDRSIDGIWSFDVFVHINKPDVAAYLTEMRRVMKPGAVAVIHHGRVGGKLGGWRSDLTHEDMLELIDGEGFDLECSVTEWHDGEVTHRLDTYDDVISVFRAP